MAQRGIAAPGVRCRRQPAAFRRHPPRVPHRRSSRLGMGKDGAKQAPLPIRLSHNIRTDLRRFRCGGRGRQKRDTEYQAECHREHISFACVPRQKMAQKAHIFSYAINRQPFGKRLAVGEHSYGGVRRSCLGRNTMGGDTSCIRRTASTILWASASWCAPCSQHAWWNHSRSRYTAGTFSGL